MDDKYIFLLLTSRDNSDKICWHLIETKKLSPPSGPPPLQSSISMASLQSKWKLRKRNNVCSKGTKGCILKHKQVRKQWTIVSLLSKFSSSMYPRGSIYSSPNRYNGGSSPSVIKAYGSPRVNLFRTLWGKLQFFLDLCTFLDVHGFCLKSCIYTRV